MQRQALDLATGGGDLGERAPDLGLARCRIAQGVIGAPPQCVGDEPGGDGQHQTHTQRREPQPHVRTGERRVSKQQVSGAADE